ncbi:MAG TPA: hypothetical protein V6D14_26445 [Coleofasciculaceae cyanobacterium]
MRCAPLIPPQSSTSQEGETGGVVLIGFGVTKLLTQTAMLHTDTIVGSPDRVGWQVHNRETGRMRDHLKHR